jgi:hypothetical protein
MNEGKEKGTTSLLVLHAERDFAREPPQRSGADCI